MLVEEDEGMQGYKSAVGGRSACEHWKHRTIAARFQAFLASTGDEVEGRARFDDPLDQQPLSS